MQWVFGMMAQALATWQCLASAGYMMAEFGSTIHDCKPCCQQYWLLQSRVKSGDDAEQGGLNKCDLILLAAGSPAASA
jgi:hypothetical protein